MADTNDTIDGLLAEFRGYAAGMPPSYHVTMSWADFRKMLDRFDAAHRREKAAIEADALAVGGIVEAERKRERGDAAKLREALEAIISGYENADLCDTNYGEWCHEPANPCVNVSLCKAIHESRAALAAPPRNCDIGSAEEQSERLHAYCKSHRCLYCSSGNGDECKFYHPGMKTDCKIKWANAPYEEGGAK